MRGRWRSTRRGHLQAEHEERLRASSPPNRPTSTGASSSSCGPPAGEGSRCGCRGRTPASRGRRTCHRSPRAWRWSTPTGTDSDVWFRLGLPEVSSSLDLNRMREAIVRGAPGAGGLMEDDVPFVGIKVVELAVAVAGPSAAAVLADWGAAVVKIEPPTATRSALLTAAGVRRPSSSTTAASAARRSISGDQRARWRSATVCSTAPTSSSPTSALPRWRRLGLDPERSPARNPRLVYGRVTGLRRRPDRTPTARRMTSARSGRVPALRRR